jgi:AraC-type DNA-binding domain-containing proteins
MNELAEFCQEIYQVNKIRNYENILEINVESMKKDGDIYLEGNSVIVMPQKDFFVTKYLLFKGNMTYFFRSDHAENVVIKNMHESVFHRHDYIELTYVVSGTLTQYIDNDKVELKAGEISIMDCNCLHREVTPQENSVVLFLCLSTKFFDMNILNGENQNQLQQFISLCISDKKKLRQYTCLKPHGAAEGVDQILLQITQESYYRNLGYQYVLKALIMRLFERLGKQYDFSINTKQKGSRVQNFSLIERYIKENLAEITIADLEDRFYFGKNYFNQLILEQTGLTYSQYLQKLRMEKAACLLLQTDLPVDAIAIKMGYSNRSHFYKLFEAYYHSTPKKYRENYCI